VPPFGAPFGQVGRTQRQHLRLDHAATGLLVRF
jgi:hypothetical protein